MAMRRLTAAIFLALFTASSAQAGEFPKLTSEELHKVLDGNTIVGYARNSVGDSTPYFFSEEHFSGGTALFIATSFNFEEKGVWYTLGHNKVCYKYPSSKDYPGATCIWVYESKGCYYTYGLKSMTINGPKNYDDWSGRWIIEGSGKSCAAPVS